MTDSRLHSSRDVGKADVATRSETERRLSTPSDNCNPDATEDSTLQRLHMWRERALNAERALTLNRLREIEHAQRNPNDAVIRRILELAEIGLDVEALRRRLPPQGESGALEEPCMPEADGAQ